MRKPAFATVVLVSSMALGMGCASSSDEQRQALTHQQRSDAAANRGAYGVAAKEQREAADSHHDAVVKAINEGQPIPPQTQVGDKPPPQTP
jgi:hypothetical protein